MRHRMEKGRLSAQAGTVGVTVRDMEKQAYIYIAVD